MSTFEHKNSLRKIEAQIVQKLKNNEARPKFTGSYKKKRVDHGHATGRANFLHVNTPLDTSFKINIRCKYLRIFFPFDVLFRTNWLNAPSGT